MDEKKGYPIDMTFPVGESSIYYYAPFIWANGGDLVSEDGLTYTFTLKDGLKWSDGSDLTAGDFEYSWKRVLNPDTASPAHGNCTI